MPIKIRKLPNQDSYKVYNTETKKVYSFHTTLASAKKQKRLLNQYDKIGSVGGMMAQEDSDQKTARAYIRKISISKNFKRSILALINDDEDYANKIVIAIRSNDIDALHRSLLNDYKDILIIDIDAKIGYLNLIPETRQIFLQDLPEEEIEALEHLDRLSLSELREAINAYAVDTYLE